MPKLPVIKVDLDYIRASTATCINEVHSRIMQHSIVGN